MLEWETDRLKLGEVHKMLLMDSFQDVGFLSLDLLIIFMTNPIKIPSFMVAY